MSLAETHVGEIAATLPGATAIFRQHKIDFCCGGARPLAEVCAERGLAVETMVGELQKLSAGRDRVAGWQDRPLSELIEHILANYHEKHRVDLPELIRLASRVEAVHRDNPNCPTGLAAALRETQTELEQHMQKEEQILFPMIGRGMGAMADGPISVMQHEHDEHGERLRRLEKLAHNLQLPPDACNTWRATYAGVRGLINDVMEHIHLENNVLFPRALGGK